MRAAAVILVVVAVAGCGRSTESGDPSGVPDLSITALRSNGLSATIELAVTDGGDLLDVQIDWGDGSAGTTLRGEGRLSADHAYVPGTDEVTVTVEATDADGNVVSSGRSLVLPESVAGTAPLGTETTSTAVFAAAGPNPRLQVLLDTRISAELTTGDWAGMQALMYAEAVGTYGRVEFGRSEQVIAEIDRDGDAALRDEPFGFGFGSPVDGEPSPIRIALTARCSVAGSTNAFGVLSEAACDAYEARQILLANARLTVSGSAG